MKTIVFNNKSRDFVLALFDKSIDSDGYIIESKTGARVLTPNGDEVKKEDFAGFNHGSEIVLTKDLPSLLRYADMEQ
jgi:hypothetical protein